MKKLAGLVLSIFILSNFAFAGSIPTYDTESSEIIAPYKTSVYQKNTIFLYDVTNVLSGTEGVPEFVSMEETPIVGIAQELTDGSFSIEIKEDFSGMLAVRIGGVVTETVSYLLQVENGSVTSIMGDMAFDGNSLLDALVGGKIVRLVAPEKEESNYTGYAYGFMQKVNIAQGTTKHSFKLFANGSANGKVYRNAEFGVAEFDLGEGYYNGAVRFKAFVRGVPEDVEITAE